MKRELYEKLYAKYPDIFQEGKLTPFQSCMGRGIECDDGWYDLLDNLCNILQIVYTDTGVLTIARQVKEKFGTLRFYVGFKNTGDITDARFQAYCTLLDNTIENYCGKSSEICEVCGEDKTAKMRNSMPWIRCLCDEHEAARLAEYNIKNLPDEKEIIDS